MVINGNQDSCRNWLQDWNDSWTIQIYEGIVTYLDLYQHVMSSNENKNSKAPSKTTYHMKEKQAKKNAGEIKALQPRFMPYLIVDNMET